MKHLVSIFSKIKRKYFFVFFGIVLIVLVGVYFSFNPEDRHFFPPCPFYKITGLKCPGCGTQRALHSLFHLEFKQAMMYNPLLVMAIPFIITLIYFDYFGGKVKFPTIHRKLNSSITIYVVLIIIVLYWVLRNISTTLYIANFAI